MISSIEAGVIAAVLDAAVRGSLILLGALGATSLMRRSSASARHLVWLAALLGILLLPTARSVVPEWRVVLLPQAARGAFAAAPATSAASLPGAPLSSSSSIAEPSVGTPPAPRPSAVGWLGFALLLWAAGAALVALRLAIGLVRVRWLASRAVELTDESWIRLTDGLTRQLGLGRIVRLLRGPGGAVPMTWGIFGPVILLPGDADQWNEERRRVVLAHELAHVRRWDALTQWVAHLTVALYWFNPLVWVAARKLREERERACDDAVLAVGAAPTEYADHLLTIVRSLGRSDGAMGALAMARRSQFEGRLLAILDSTVRRNGVPRAAALAILLASAACVLPLAALHPVEHAEPMRTTDAAGRERWPDAVPADLASTLDPSPARSLAGQGRLVDAASGGAAVRYAEIIRAAEDMDSDGGRRDVLMPLLYRPDLSLDNVIAILAAARGMGSPKERQPVLIAAVRHRAFRSSEPAAVEALSEFSSATEHRVVLQNLLQRPSLTQADLVGVLRAAAYIQSSPDLRAVLVTAAQGHRLEAAARAAYLEAARSLDSDADRGLALQVLLLQAASDVPRAGQAAWNLDWGTEAGGRELDIVARKVIHGRNRWDILRIEPGGHLMLEERRASGEHRRLEAVPGPGGLPVFTYRLNGQMQGFTSIERDWMASIIQEFEGS